MTETEAYPSGRLLALRRCSFPKNQNNFQKLKRTKRSSLFCRIVGDEKGRFVIMARQSDQIGRNFPHLGFFLKAKVFLGNKVASRRLIFWASFSQQFCVNFHLHKTVSNHSFCRYFEVSKVV